MTHTSKKTEMPTIHHISDAMETADWNTTMLPARRRVMERDMFVTADGVVNAHEVADSEEDQPGTLGRLRVQADAKIIVAELQLDKIAVNDAWIENYVKDPHHCDHEGQQLTACNQVRLKLNQRSFVHNARFGKQTCSFLKKEKCVGRWMYVNSLREVIYIHAATSQLTSNCRWCIVPRVAWKR